MSRSKLLAPFRYIFGAWLPVVTYITIFLLLILAAGWLAAKVVAESYSSIRIFIGFAVFLAIALVTRYPDLFRPPLSFKVGMALTYIFTVTHGMVAGFVFGILSSLLETEVMKEFPQQRPITIITRIIYGVFLANYIGFSFGFIYSILLMLTIDYVIIIPVRLFLGKAPLWYLLQEAVFNVFWNGWFFWIFGASLLGIIGGA